MKTYQLMMFCLLVLLPFLALAQPTVTVETIDNETTEAAGNTAVLRFARTGSTAASLTIDADFDPSTTATSSDYSDNNNGFFRSFARVTIPAGETFFDLVLTANPDNTVENTERIDITITDTTTYLAGTPTSAGFDLIDDPPIATVTAIDDSSTEGGDSAVLRFERSGGNFGSALTIDADFDPSTTASSNDYSDNNNGFFRSFARVTIPSDEAFFDLVLTANPDNTVENTERVDITITDTTTYLAGAPASAGFDLIDDAPIVTVTAIDDSTTEGGDSAVLRFERSGGNFNSALTIDAGFDPSTTGTNNDYSDNNNGFFRSFARVTIPAGEAFFDLVLSANSDDTIENTERVDITITDTTTYLAGTPANAGFDLIEDRLFTNSFETFVIRSNAKRCPAAQWVAEDPARYFDAGPVVIDLENDVTYRRCALGEYFDWLAQTCRGEAQIKILSLNPSQSLDRFNTGDLGDNHGFDNWGLLPMRTTNRDDKPNTMCLVRDNR